MKSQDQRIVESEPQAYAYLRLIQAQDNSPVDFKFIKVNKTFEKITGLSNSELIGQSFKLLFNDPKETMVYLHKFNKIALGEPGESLSWNINNSSRSFRMDVFSVEPMTIIILLSDSHDAHFSKSNKISNSKRSSNIPNEPSSRLQQLSEYTRTYIWECDKEGLYTYLSDNVKDIIGYEPEELIGKTHYYDLFSSDVRESLREEIDEILNTTKNLVDFPNDLVTKTNLVLSVSTNCFPILDENGHLKGYRGSNVDVTSRKKIEDALRLSEKKFLLITENISDVIWVLKPLTNELTYITPSVLSQIGYTPEEAMKIKAEDLILSTSFEKFKETIDKGAEYYIQHPEEDKIWVFEIQEYCKDGTIIWVESSMRFRFDEQGEVEVVGVSRNIDHRKQTEKEILYLSYHDQLTGVYNRAFYEEEILRLNTARNLPFTLVVCDINGLKLTNDAFGHMAGDRLIISLAQVFQRVCRKDDIIARIGGDEFALLLPKTSEKVAQMVLSRIYDEITLTKPERIKLSASFGLKTKTSVDEDFSEIFKQAEDRMYLEKIKHHSNIKTGTIDLVATSLFEKYPEEKKHAHNVSVLCRKIGEALGMTSREVADLEMAGFLHDIGKIGLEEGLINPEKYAIFDETPEFKRHSEMGYQILRSVYTYAHIAEYILAHHEWFNGMGYPKGLKGNEIPLQGRIIKLANDFSSQIDREGSDIPKTMKFIEERSNIQYDPALVLLLKKMYGNSTQLY
ncbi:MAG: PAS domain S-box protein [Erysipelotrichaceae bacterium]|nr:PAS domain S-box protein [Erysipelotrichaceae bacterium]